ncbi:MAG TPA: hypothetical protein VM658_16255 [bacterium]|nr:hypothetical protein [bacterium]
MLRIIRIRKAPGFILKILKILVSDLLVGDDGAGYETNSLLSKIGRKKTAKSAKDRQVNHDVSLRPGKEQLRNVGPNRLGGPADGSAKQEIFAPKPS